VLIEVEHVLLAYLDILFQEEYASKLLRFAIFIIKIQMPTAINAWLHITLMLIIPVQYYQAIVYLLITLAIASLVSKVIHYLIIFAPKE
jgi:hypothetical protein